MVFGLLLDIISSHRYLIAVFVLLAAFSFSQLDLGSLLLAVPTVLFTAPTASPNMAVSLGWYPPSASLINNLTNVAAPATTGVYNFTYNSSMTPSSLPYGTYNWCNMPHVRSTEYIVPDKSQYQLAYVELIHRHHKRTPYAANSFPVESYHWNCDDQGLFYFGRAFGAAANGTSAVEGYWAEQVGGINPFVPSGFIGTCQFPQITSQGLVDSWQHGKDLYGVYGDLLGFLPSRKPGITDSAALAAQLAGKVQYRVTNNVITSQVAGSLVAGMWNINTTSVVSIPLSIQATSVDSLEPQYTCPVGSALFSTNISNSANNPAWAAHFSAASSLYAALDDISGVPVNDAGFHMSFDHYYDNLSARQCHGKPLPCKLVNGANDTSQCVTQSMANEVYRFGQWEYSQIFRDNPLSLAASVGTYGVWIAELAAHLRAVVQSDGSGPDGVMYRHNVAHDGSVSRVLSILQLDTMVWPGMGAEVVFELWKKIGGAAVGAGCGAANATTGGNEQSSGYVVRVLWGGQVLKSSNPSLGVMNMVPVETVLAYFDGLVGVNASLVKSKCGAR